MTRRSALAIQIAIAAVALFAVHRCYVRYARAPATAPRTAGSDDSVAASRGAITAAGRAAPPWFGDPALPRRRIAGTVVDGDVPVAGARVVLRTYLVDAGGAVPVEVVTTENGTFDFGPLVAARYSLAATHGDQSSAVIALDLRDPSAQPPADSLVIALRGCDVTIRGTIRDVSGGVVAGARVGVTDGLVVGPLAVSSDDAGRYSVCTTRGETRLRVDAFGYGTLAYDVVAQGDLDQDITLFPEGIVVGTVTRDGAPVTGAYVWAIRKDEGAARATVATISNPEGRFQLDGLHPGRIRLMAYSADAVLRDVVEATIAVGVSVDIDLELTSSTSVSGWVTKDGTPVAGAEIVAISTNGGVSRTTRTQADGSFTTHLVPVGEVRFTVTGHEVVSPALLMTASSASTGVEVVVRGGGKLIGLVSCRGRPAAAASVAALGSGANHETTTGRDGRFAFEHVPQGTYAVVASADDCAGEARASASVAPSSVASVSLELGGSTIVTGRVVDRMGDAVPGAAVQWIDERGLDRGLAVTDTAGRFRAGMTPGSKEIEVRLSLADDEPVAFVDPGSAHLDVTASTATVETTLRVDVTRTEILGHARDGQGNPLGDVAVTIEREHAAIGNTARVDVLTNDDGEFFAGGLVPGRYRVRAVHASGATAELRGVRAGSSDVVIRLDAGGTIRGTVSGFHGAVRVHATRLEDGRSRTVMAARDRFEVRALAAGSYTVVADDGQRSAVVAIALQTGTSATVRMVAGESATVVARALDARTDEPVAGLLCDAVLANAAGAVPPAYRRRTATQLDGSARMAVAAGELLVRCRGNPAIVSDGRATVNAPPGAEVSVEVRVVSRRHPLTGLVEIGAVLADPLSPVVTAVRPGSPAARARLAVGDRIRAVDDRSVDDLTVHGVILLIGDRDPGPVRLEVDGPTGPHAVVVDGAR